MKFSFSLLLRAPKNLTCFPKVQRFVGVRRCGLLLTKSGVQSFLRNNTVVRDERLSSEWGGR